MTDETPEERLERLMQEAKEKHGLSPRDEPEMTTFTGKDAVDNLEKHLTDGAPAEVRDVLKGLLDKVRESMEGDDGVTIHEVHVRGRGRDNRPSEKSEKEAEKRREKIKHNPQEGVFPISSDMIEVLDPVMRERGETFVETLHADACHYMVGLPREHPHMVFLMTMGTMFARAGFSAAMLRGASTGQGGVTPEDLNTAFSGVMATLLLEGIRFGQANPDAFTAADGVDFSKVTEGIDEWIAGLQNEPGTDEGNQEEH